MEHTILISNRTMKYIPKEKTIRKRKFSDKEFLDSYNSGYSDGDMAKEFKCSKSSVIARRVGLELVNNYVNINTNNWNWTIR